jgi:hypothetical protein
MVKPFDAVDSGLSKTYAGKLMSRLLCTGRKVPGDGADVRCFGNPSFSISYAESVRPRLEMSTVTSNVVGSVWAKDIAHTNHGLDFSAK